MPAVFSDIVGTCYGYEAPIEALTERFGAKLEKYGLPPRLFFHAVQLASERDCVYLGLVGRPKKSITERWVENFAKTLYQAGLTREHADEVFDKEDVEYVLDVWLYSMKPRPGFEEMLQIYKDAGIEFYAASNAVPDRVKEYFKKAGIKIAEDRIADFTSVGVDKPAREPYQFLMDKYGDKDETVIFQAAHAWDLAGAKQAGFLTAYCSVYEYKACPSLWGEPDVQADDLPSLARAVVAKWGKGAKK